MRETFLYQINVTRDCNIRCSHCYISSETKANSRFMRADRFLSIIDQIVAHLQTADQYQHGEIHVVGGEPGMLGAAFFRDVVPEARRRLVSAKQVCGLRLVSNLLAPDALEIARMFDLVSTSYEVETRFSKRALELRWEERVRQLQMEGRNVAVTMSITRRATRKGAVPILEFFKSRGLHQIHLGFFVPSGDGLANSTVKADSGLARVVLVNEETSMAPSHEDTSQFLIEAADWYLSHRGQFPDMCINPIDSMLSAIEANEPIDDIVCPIISGCVDIDWNGNAGTCIQAGGNENVRWLGNVFETPINELVEQPSFRREVIKAAAPRRVCRTCDEYRVCMSGCGVLHDFWDEQGECPGFKRFIQYMRSKYAQGERSRMGRTAHMELSKKYQVLRQ